MAKKIEKKLETRWLMAVAIGISAVAAIVPTSVSASATSSAQAREVAASGFGVIWSALGFPGRWAVASLHVQGGVFGADTLLFIYVTAAVYYSAFWFIRQMWTVRRISKGRPRNFSPMYDDDPECEQHNAFGRRPPVTVMKYPSLASSSVRSLRPVR